MRRVNRGTNEGTMLVEEHLRNIAELFLPSHRLSGGENKSALANFSCFIFSINQPYGSYLQDCIALHCQSCHNQVAFTAHAPR